MLEVYKSGLKNILLGLNNKHIRNQREMNFETACSVSETYVEPEDVNVLNEVRKLYNEQEYTLECFTNDEEDVINSPAVKIVDYLIHDAIKRRASDIHLEPWRDYIKVRYRIDGELEEIYSFSSKVMNSLISRIKVIADLDISEKRRPQDGRIYNKYKNNEVDLRVSIIPTIFGEKVVIRILTKDDSILKRANLGLTECDNHVLDNMLNKPNGIILVTGPTGSGKSTTLYSLIKEINNNKKNIITIEDPVEYVIEGVNQVSVNKKAGVTFSSGLRSILRQDPDVIMVGEIRDGETAEIGIRAAITGHIVLSTLHTNDAPSAVVRLIDMGIEPYLLSDSISGIISQRLVKKICPYCKIQYKANDYEKRVLDEDIKSDLNIYKGKGCKYCNFNGYYGRTGVFEIMEITNKHKEKIANRCNTSELLDISIRKGMKTLGKSCKELVLKGITTVDEFVKIY